MKKILLCLTIVSYLITTNIAFAQAPVANFKANTTVGCGFMVVTFTDQSTGSPTSWSWDFGDKTANSVQQNPTHAFFSPGIFTVKLTATNGSGSNTVTKTNLILIHALPNTDFSANNLSGCLPMNVTFTNLSTPGDTVLTSYLWDFGNGNSSFSKDPINTYKTSGVYQVSLSVTDANGCVKKEIRKDYITVLDKPKASFSNSANQACAPPLSVNFTNTSTGAVSYNWDFGDGNTTTTTSPSNNYLSTGDYTVRLILTSGSGCSDTLTMSKFIQVGTYKSKFGAVPPIGCKPQNVQFTDSTVGATSWTWDFGDGSAVSNAKNPSHTYVNTGSYTVSLTTVNSIGCSNTATMNNVIIVNSNPVVGFTADKTAGCGSPFVVNFTDNTLGATAWLWNFGDGTTANTQNPNHTYSSNGSYNVSLKVTNNNNCTDSLTKISYINIVTPTVVFTADTLRGCLPFSVNFKEASTSNNPITSWLWNFGDGSTFNGQNPPTHIYAADTGSFDVSLTITNSIGCTNTLTKNDYIEVGKKPVVAYSGLPLKGCHRLSVNFTNTTSAYAETYFWEFGDGQTSVLKDPLHIYADTGFFRVKLTASFHGCIDSLSKKDYIYVLPPKPEFSADKTMECNDTFLLVKFTDMSKGAETWFWDFGDGTTFNGQNPPPHNYTNTGLYSVKLVTTNKNGCKDSTIKANCITISDIEVGFKTNSPIICKNSNVVFTDTSRSNIGLINWKWDMGDKTTVNAVSSTSHTYNKAGVYLVKMIITNAIQCKDSIVKPIIIAQLPSPQFSANVTTGCTPLTVNFNSFGSSAAFPSTIKKYFWTFGDGGTDTVASPKYVYKTRGVYNVSLRITDSNGCDSTLTKVNYINPTHSYANFTVPALTCFNNTVSFTNTSSGIGLSYIWDFGDGSPTVKTTNATHKYTVTITSPFNVKLTAIDTNGCDSIIIKPISISKPQANFIADTTKGGCPPLFVNFFNKSTKDVDSLKWDFGDGAIINDTTQKPQHVFSKPGNYGISLYVTNKDGCKDTLTKPNYILIEGPSGTFTFTPLSGCAPASIKFVAKAKNTDAYQWIFGDGGTATGDSVVYTYKIGDTYTPLLMLKKYNALTKDTCFVPVVSDRKLIIYSGKVDFTVDTASSCKPRTSKFADISIAYPKVDSWKWTFGDGATDTIQHPTHLYNKTGSYNVSLTIKVNNCIYTKTSNDFINIGIIPTANFTNAPNYAIVDNKIAFIDSSSVNVSKWNWDFGDSQTSSIQNPYHVYNTEGKYKVTLIVNTQYNCKDTVTKEITVVKYIPNAFTPDNDGINDVYMKGYNLTIINRWGQTLYEGTEGWDGKYKGDKVLPGTYFYIITFDGTDNKQIKVNGALTLIRK